MKKYIINIVDLKEIDGEIYYTFNVYKRFLLFFWKTVFEVIGTDKEKCYSECKQFINRQ